MSLPSTVTGEEVIVGGGLHAAVYAATRVATGHPAPVVLEKEQTTGGVFARLANFRMNSANGASVASVASPGPTRVTPVSPSDDLNYLPNAPYQVRDESGMVEYPYSQDMARVIARTLLACAAVYTGAEFSFTAAGDCYTADGTFFGTAKRIIFAAGLTVPELPQGKAILSGFDFLRKPVRDLGAKKIALVGAGDTAAQAAEWMLGQGVAAPSSAPRVIHWYGGFAMPAVKKRWMRERHARWAGIGRHLPQGGSTAVICPYPVRGVVIPLGDTAMVNGQLYDLVIMATGFTPAPCPVRADSVFIAGDGMAVARWNGGRVFKVGTAANLVSPYRPYASRFPAAQQAIYNLAPRTAALAASLP